ncbi:MAG TPA: hypothetical protein VN736_20020 [Candidatus Limnocylindrales bacterium]|nr:hypothetical protein [Candidatus Limnocylindrales bacterium]
MRTLLCLAAMAAGSVWAQVDHPDLNGVWQRQSNDSKVKSETLNIAQKPDSIDIVRSVDTGGRPIKDEINCSTEGKDCKVKEEGQDTQVSMYYNGPMLVMIEQRHGNDYVTKRRLKLSPDGKTLTMEVMTINPPGKATENLTYTKQSQTATK